MSLAEQLKVLIDGWTNEIRQSQLYRLAERGRITPDALAFYLESVRHLFHHSEQNLATCASRSRELELAALFRYFERKVREEHGHERWPEADLTHLPANATRALRPAVAIDELLALQGQLIAVHPICFTAYVVWAEYMTAILGDETLALLASCGFDRSQLTAIVKHTEADREHAMQGFCDLDALWSEQVELDAVLDGVRKACTLFHAFCDEIYGVAQRAA